MNLLACPALETVRNCDFDQCRAALLQFDAWEQQKKGCRQSLIRIEEQGHVLTSGPYL
jgi:hypothetical protein